MGQTSLTAKEPPRKLMKETRRQKLVRVMASKLGYTLWRNNIGLGYQGKQIRRDPDVITLANWRSIVFGVGGRGGSDLIGFQSIKITPDMVGSSIAVFTAIECKGEHGRTSPAQQAFIDTINKAGGTGLIVRDENELITTTTRG